MRARAFAVAGLAGVVLAVACSSKSSGHFPYRVVGETPRRPTPSGSPG